MGTPIKNISKLLSPRLLSPISPNFLKVLNKEVTKNYERKTQVAKKIDFSESNRSNINNAITPVKIKITNVDEVLLKDAKKRDILINTPNKQKFIRNGIGDERLFNILGRGSFGKVFKATHKGHPVAMKLVRKTSYVREKNSLSLNHKNLVTTLEIVENEMDIFSLILMEYLPSCDNLQNILNNAVTSFEELLKYAFDVCEGIKYCHSKNVLHLDLKPSNILVFNGICKICDFGNSVKNFKRIDQFEHHGTIHYTAPEILLGQSPSEKSDVYSLGIIFWQLKTRRCPYSEIDNIECIIYKVVKCKLRPELENPIDQFSQLYHQCWNQNYSERPTVSDILQKKFLFVN